MKALKYIALFIGVSIFSSCESWLDENPEYTTNTLLQFSTEEKAQMALDGCYGYLTTWNTFGQSLTELNISASGISWAKTNGDAEDNWTSLEALPSNGNVLGMAWTGLYKVIMESNAFISNIEKSSLDAEVIKRMRGEAKFVRAVAFYELATIWGDVPFTTSGSASDAVELPRTDKAVIFAQCEQDWTDAKNDLEGVAAVDGRASSNAATAFLGRMYHFLACREGSGSAYWGKAKECFDAVYGKYALANKFSDLFVTNVSGSKESIFQLNFSVTSSYNQNRLHWLFSPKPYGTGITWARVTGTKAFYDKFQGTYPNDPRLAGTFFRSYRNQTAQVGTAPSANDSNYVYPYFSYDDPSGALVPGSNKKKKIVGCLPYAEVSNPANPTIEELKALPIGLRFVNAFAQDGRNYGAMAFDAHPVFKKYDDPGQSGQNAHLNLILYRYAELLLDMADVYNELNEGGMALGYVKEVLARARRSGTGATQPADWPSGLTKEELREKIYMERIFETFGEYGQYQRVRLWGTQHDFFKKALLMNNEHNLTRRIVTAMNGNTLQCGERMYGEGIGLNKVITDAFLKKNLLLPIPNEELNANSNITTNNEGY